MGDLEHPGVPPDPDAAPEPVAMEAMGQIQMLSIAFPGNHFRGEILPELERLKKAGIVRVLDLLLVRKDELGNVMVTTASDLDWEEAISFGSYVGALAGYAAAGPAGDVGRVVLVEADRSWPQADAARLAQGAGDEDLGHHDVLVLHRVVLADPELGKA